MIFLFIVLQLKYVVMEITKCEQVPIHPETIYPTNTNQFVQSMDNFFHGDGLTYSVVNSTQFKVSQSYTLTQTTQSTRTAFPTGTRFIDDAAQTDWKNPNYQTGLFAALVEYEGIYYVYELQNTGKPAWSQLKYGISSTQTVLCVNIEFIFESDLLISCITREEGFQIFYYLQMVLIKQTILRDIPIIIRVDTTLFLSNTLEFSYLQVLNDRGKNIYVTVAHGNYYNPSTRVYVFRVEFKRDITNPSDILTFTHHYVGQHDKAVYGVYQANDKVLYVLYEDELVKHDLRRPLDNNEVLMTVKSAQGMGVFKETYTNGNYNVFITIVTTRGLEFYSTSNLQSDQKPNLPDGFNTNKKLSINVNLQYSIVSNGEVLVAYQNRYSLKENKAQYGFLFFKKFTVNNILIVFYSLSSSVTIFDNTYIYQFQLQTPYLYSVNTGSQNYNQQLPLQLQATSYNGLICYCNIQYELLDPTQVENFVSESNKREREDPILLFNSQSKLIKLSDLFIGSNLNYTADVKQVIDEAEANTTVIEPIMPTVSIIQTVNVDIIENHNFVIFTYSYQLNEDTYYLFTQNQNYLNQISVQKCKFIACYNVTTIETGIRQPVVGIAAHQAELVFHIVLAYQAEVMSLDFETDDFKNRIRINQKKLSQISEISKQSAPDISITNIYFLSEAILILTNTPNSIICVDTILNQQYVIQGNLLSARQIFINPQLFNDTYFVDNQYELLIIQQTKNLEVKELTRDLYNYTIVNSFAYPNSFKQQQISVGIVRQGIYLVQVTAQNSFMYFYPLEYIYFETTTANKQQFQIQTIQLYNYGITIQQPFISGYSNNDKFYIVVSQNNTNQYQLFVIQPSPYEFSQLYTIIDLPFQPSSLNVISIQRDLNQFRDESLNFEYDVLILQNTNTNQINAIQIFKEALLLYTPNIQQNRVDTFYVNVNVINDFNQANPAQITISRQFKTSKLELGIIERENQVPYNINTSGSIFQVQVNPADFFYGYASNYTVINKVGLRLDLQDVYLDCFQKKKQHQVINTSAIEPMIVVQANFSLVYKCVVSGILAGTDYIQTFIQSNRSIYILFQNEAFYLYSIPAPLNAECIYSFITSDTGFLISVCTNLDDTYFYYYNGTNIQNRTMITAAALEFAKQPLPGLISAQFAYNVLALQYKDLFVTAYVNATSTTFNLTNVTTYKYIYKLQSYSLFIVDLIQLSQQNQTAVNDSSPDSIQEFLQNMKPGIMFLYENTVLEVNFNTTQYFIGYQSKLPNGLKLLTIHTLNIGWITTTYVSLPILIATTTASYYFQLTIPIIEKGGKLPEAYLIYKLISYNRYQTLGVYTGGGAIVGLFHTNSSEIGEPEFIFGLYGIPSLRNYQQDTSLEKSFSPNKVYQHVGESVGFIGIKNHSNYNITNPIITSNQTMLYQVNQTLFQYIYLNTQLVITINQVECINTSSIHHALNQTIIELIATNNQTEDFSRNSFMVYNQYPKYTFWVTENRRRNFWWQFGFGVAFFFIIIGVLTYLCVNSNKIIVYQERLLEPPQVQQEQQ